MYQLKLIFNIFNDVCMCVGVQEGSASAGKKRPLSSLELELHGVR